MTRRHSVLALKQPLLSTRTFAVHDIPYHVHVQPLLPGVGYRVWITRIHAWSSEQLDAPLTAPLFEEMCPDHAAMQQLLDQIEADPTTFMMEGAL